MLVSRHVVGGLKSNPTSHSHPQFRARLESLDREHFRDLSGSKFDQKTYASA
jgi:hypothetical protein